MIDPQHYKWFFEPTTAAEGHMHAIRRTIVETKAGRAGSGADRLLWSLRHRPCPVSKYGTGLAALRPDLPANRWLPVLRRHFPTAPALNGSLV